VSAVVLRLAISADAQQATNALERFGFQTTEKGLHHRVWSKVVSRTNISGTIFQTTNRIVELSTGVHRWVTNQAGVSLVESRPEFAFTTNGILARGASHSALFTSNANSYAALQVKLPSGELLKSHFLGLAYHDTSTGSNVMFSVLQDSTAELING